MRTETIERTVYKLDELSERAQERAHEKYLEHADYPWSSENKESLEEFERLFPVKITDWDYGYRNYISFHLSGLDYDEVEEFTGVRLATWLYNQFNWTLYSPKIYYLPGSNYSKKRKSRFQRVEDEYIFTGYHADYPLVKPIIDFINKPDGRNLYDVMNDCLYGWVYSCRDDYESTLEFEYFKDAVEANEWEFDEDGNMA